MSTHDPRCPGKRTLQVGGGEDRGRSVLHRADNDMRKGVRRLLSALIAGAVLAVAAPSASAGPPGNDDFDRATVVSSLPFSDSESTLEATRALDDPTPSCGGSHGATVWYAYTPTTDVLVEANTFGSDYDTPLSVWTGGRGSLQEVTCNDDASGVQSRVSFTATAGQTYYVMAASYSGGPGGSLSITTQEPPPPPPPPANDDIQ